MDRFKDIEAPDGSLVVDNFANWFGASVVLDEHGGPLPVFHGSKVARLPEFCHAFVGSGVVSNNSSKRDYGGAFFFTSNRQNAEFYADFDGVSPDEDFIVEAYLSIRRPYVAEFGMSPTNAIVAAQQANVDHMLAGGNNGDWDDLYDGVILREILDGSHHSDVYIAFKAEQIKSVHNSGLFDPESASLRDSLDSPEDVDGLDDRPPAPASPSMVQRSIFERERP